MVNALVIVIGYKTMTVCADHGPVFEISYMRGH